MDIRSIRKRIIIIKNFERILQITKTKTVKKLKDRGHKVSFIHFDNPSNSNESKPLFLANDPEVSLPYLIKSQVYTIPSPRAEKELRDSLKRLKPDIVHASLTLSPLDFRLPELCKRINLPLVGTFHPA